MLLIDVEQYLEVAGACGVAAFLRRAELLQMQVADAGLVKARRELALGESGATRGRDRARIDDQSHAGARELVDDGGGLGLFVADGEECHGPNISRQRLKFSAARPSTGCAPAPPRRATG